MRPTRCLAALLALLLGGCLSESEWDQYNGDSTCQIDGLRRCSGSSLEVCTNGSWSSTSCQSTCQQTNAVYDHCGYDETAGSDKCFCTSGSSCSNVDCNGHGTCSSGACKCSTGYTGASCDSCASGYSGYPNCATKTPTCACSSKSAPRCSGTDSLKTCDDGCQWTTRSCSLRCQPKRSEGCATDPTTGNDTCFCPEAGQAIILFSFVDDCPDGISTTLELYDTTANKKGGPFTLSYGKTWSQAFTVPIGDKVCYGAWASSNYWGCGQQCQQTCSNCCYTAGSGGLTASAKLTCSP